MFQSLCTTVLLLYTLIRNGSLCSSFICSLSDCFSDDWRRRDDRFISQTEESYTSHSSSGRSRLENPPASGWTLPIHWERSGRYWDARKGRLQPPKSNWNGILPIPNSFMGMIKGICIFSLKRNCIPTRLNRALCTQAAISNTCIQKRNVTIKLLVISLVFIPTELWQYHHFFKTDVNKMFLGRNNYKNNLFIIKSIDSVNLVEIN